MNGVIRTIVGYTGGTTPDPTYTNLGDHTESIELEFDPGTVDYQTLLSIFWDSHDPTAEKTCSQYKAAAYYHDEEQRVLAEASKAEQVLEHGIVHTEILEAGVFYPAEAYHQKYYLQGNEILMEDFDAIYPDHEDFVGSTAAARVLGVLGHFYTAERLEDEIDSFGLSEDSNEELRKYVH